MTRPGIPRPGVVSVVQTFGDRANFHPHVHALATRGGWTSSGEWVAVPYVDERAAEKLFRHKVLALLRRRGLLSQERIDLFLAWTLALNGLKDEVSEVVHTVVALNPTSVAADMARFLESALRGDEKGALESVTPQLLGAGSGAEFYARFLTDSYALIDRKAEALDWLERDIDLGFINSPYLSRLNPLLANIRDEARFKELMRSVKSRWQELEA